MKWVGLTGGMGSGKSSVTKLFRKHGIPVVDADALARDVVAKGSLGLAEVVQRFGPGVLTVQGELDRRALGSLVFGKSDALLDLENILHPLIQAKVQQARDEFERLGVPVALYDVPLLFEKNLEDQFDYILVVWVPIELQIERVMARDALTREEVHLRLKNQLPLDEKKHRADFVIDNSGNFGALEICVMNLANQLIEGCARDAQEMTQKTSQKK